MSASGPLVRAAWRSFGLDRPSATAISLFVTAYLLGAGFAQLLAIMPDTGISIWPPAGLLMARLAAARRRTWTWWLGLALGSELVANLLWFHNALPVAVFINVANACEAVTGALLLKAFLKEQPRLSGLRQMLALVVLGAAAAPLVGATLASATLAGFGMQPFVRAWPLFYVGNATGVLIVAPLTLVLLHERFPLPRPSLGTSIEVVLLGVAFVAINVLTLSGYLAFAYVTMPVILWAAVRFEVRGAALMLPVLALMAALFTVGGAGQFAGDPQSQTRLHLLLQLFLAISAVSALLVGALARQHRVAVEDLRAANSDLETRVRARTRDLVESERRIAAVLDALPMGVALIDPKGRTLLGNEYFHRQVPELLGPALEDGDDYAAGYEVDGRPLAREEHPATLALAGESVWPGQEMIFRDEQRGPVWTRVAALPFRDESGRVIAATTVVADIDKKRRALDALQTSEARMRLVQERAGVGTWEWNLVTGKLVWSEQVYRLHGLEMESEPVDRPRWRRAVHPEDFVLVEEAVRGAVERHADFDIEYRVIHGDGTTRWLVARGRVVDDEAGRALSMMGISFDITERKEAEEQRLLLAREVDHRAKNALAAVQSLVRLTKIDDPAAFARTLEGRIAALARAHTLLARESWAGGDLGVLLAEELAAYVSTGQVVLEGPTVLLEPDAVQPLSMSAHELATNAAKYGALSVPGGQVTIRWRQEGETLLLRWTESGGPTVATPTRTGFGSKLLDATVRGQLRGRLTTSWLSSGLECLLEISTSYRSARRPTVGRPETRPEPALVADAPTAVVRPGLRVLLAEDESLVAMDVTLELERVGCRIVAVAGTLEELLRHVEATVPYPDVAILDVNLGGLVTVPAAERLLARGVPVVFTTGYDDLPGSRWSDEPLVRLLRKPVASADLVATIAAVVPPEPVTTRPGEAATVVELPLPEIEPRSSLLGVGGGKADLVAPAAARTAEARRRSVPDQDWTTMAASLVSAPPQLT